jgi:hypothetical protein
MPRERPRTAQFDSSLACRTRHGAQSSWSRWLKDLKIFHRYSHPLFKQSFWDDSMVFWWWRWSSFLSRQVVWNLNLLIQLGIEYTNQLRLYL